MKRRRGNPEAIDVSLSNQPTDTRPVLGAMPSEEDIRRRAYELYLTRSGGIGDAEGDWYLAERELTQRSRPSEA
jgi:hypothetical protein